MSDDADILDQIITELREQTGKDFNEQMKITDRLLKALQMKARLGKSKRGKAFNLEGSSGRQQ